MFDVVLGEDGCQGGDLLGGIEGQHQVGESFLVELDPVAEQVCDSALVALVDPPDVVEFRAAHHDVGQVVAGYAAEITFTS